MDYSGEDNLQTMKLAKNYNRFLLNLALKEIRKNKAEKIMDFGAGTGLFAAEIAENLGGGERICCIEKADNLQKFYQNNDKLKLYTDIGDFDRTADLIYSYNVLEHIKEDALILKILNDKLNANGVLLLYLPAFQCLYSSMDKKVGHYRRYTRPRLMSLLLQSGFVIEQCRYVDFAGFWVTLLYKLIGDKGGKINPRALVFFDRIIFPLSRLTDILTFGKICGKNIFCIARKR